MNNYYLSLLYKKVKELKKILKEIDNLDYSYAYKKYLISGYIITLDSILEIGIGDLHSPNFDELTSLIYYTRQKAVHYGYFNGLHNIEETADKIIELTEKYYEQEQEYYQRLFDMYNYDECNNIVIKSALNIEDDMYFYKFKSKDGKQALCVPLKRVFKLTQKSKEKVASYIIDTTNPIALYSFENEKMENYVELYGDDIKKFFRENFTVTDENYNEHNLVMQDIIHRFVTDPINSIQIMEYASDEQFCKNTIDVIKEFIIEKSMYISYIKNRHLIKDKYSLNKMPKTDYVKLQHSLKKGLSNYINQRDVFFIDMTIKRAKFYSDVLRESTTSFEFDPEILSPILIQMFETGPKHFSQKFISSNPEFKKCYNSLLKYRQVFSHYLLSGKEYREGVERFKNEFLSFIKLLQTIDLSSVKNPAEQAYDTYSLIERDKSDFFNYKHEQFLRIHNDTYIGKKIHYSSHNSKSKSLIAIIPGGHNSANIMYYKKDANDYLTPMFTIDEKTGKKSYIHTLSKPLRGARETKIDFNLSNLFKAYYELRNQKHGGNVLIFFSPSESNGNYSHYDELEAVILRFFNQGYLPIELLQKTKLDCSKLNKGILSLVNENNETIANIVNRPKEFLGPNSKKDDKNFFSRIDDITHDFSKRRHHK